MAKYDWKQLEKEYILGEEKSISAFLREKGIKPNSSNRKMTLGWKEKRGKNVDKIRQKTIEKVAELESQKQAQQIVDLRLIANDLALKVIESKKELNMHLAKNTKRTKTVQYDYKANKPKKEVIDEKEEVVSYIGIIDRKGLKELTSALKDLNDILNGKNDNNNNSESLAEAIQKAYENKIGEK